MKKENGVELNIFKRATKIFFKIVYNLLTILCLILICIIVMQKVTDSNGSIAGFRIFRVVSGSMIPRYDIGEVVICKETAGSDIKIGDTIVYRGKQGELNGKLIMHEVVEKKYDENNKLIISAKGLLNGVVDPDIGEDEVLGVVIISSFILTNLYVLATSTYSSFIIVFILALNVFMSFKPSRPMLKEKEETDVEEESEGDSEEEIEELDNIEEIEEIEEKKIEKTEETGKIIDDDTQVKPKKQTKEK